MLMYRQVGLGDGYVFVAPGTKYPQVQPQAPVVSPQTPSRTPGIFATWVGPQVTSPVNTSGQAAVNTSDAGHTDVNPTPSPYVVPEAPVFAPSPGTMTAPERSIVGVSPIGIVAVGAALVGIVGLVAIFRR